jgi:hypothetical protein
MRRRSFNARQPNHTVWLLLHFCTEEHLNLYLEMLSPTKSPVLVDTLSLPPIGPAPKKASIVYLKLPYLRS